jgi:hypothetical protein
VEGRLYDGQFEAVSVKGELRFQVVDAERKNRDLGLHASSLHESTVSSSLAPLIQ